ncbi:MAG: type IV secretion system protein [Burkholderiaceae bacterium]|nr:type IV secretion system protein [Burkholderiaceae bacterium]
MNSFVLLAQVQTDAATETAEGATNSVADAAAFAAPAVDAAARVIGILTLSIDEAFASLSGNTLLADLGASMMYMLFALALAWLLLRSLLAGTGLNGIVADLLPLLAGMAIVSALLEGGAIRQIAASVAVRAHALAGSENGELRGAVFGAAQKAVEATGNVLTMPSLHASISGWSPSKWVPLAVSGLGTVLGKLFAAFFIAVAATLYIAHIVLTLGAIKLAVALAPVMVPFFVAPALAWVFQGWLRFTLMAGMLKIVGTFVLMFTDALMQGIVTLSREVRLPADGSWDNLMTASPLVYAGLMMLAGLSACLMMQVQALARGLLPVQLGDFPGRSRMVLEGTSSVGALRRTS